MLLDDYLEDAASGKLWQWGKRDCCCFAGDWIRLATGHDPLARYRGKYSSALSAHRLIKRRGGFLPIVGRELDLFFERTANPQTGDVGIIEVPVAMHDRMPVVGAVMAIRSGPWWAARALAGIQMGSYPTIAAWTVGG